MLSPYRCAQAALDYKKATRSIYRWTVQLKPSIQTSPRQTLQQEKQDLSIARILMVSMLTVHLFGASQASCDSRICIRRRKAGSALS